MYGAITVKTMSEGASKRLVARSGSPGGAVGALGAQRF